MWVTPEKNVFLCVFQPHLTFSLRSPSPLTVTHSDWMCFYLCFCFYYKAIYLKPTRWSETSQSAGSLDSLTQTLTMMSALSEGSGPWSCVEQCNRGTRLVTPPLNINVTFWGEHSGNCTWCDLWVSVTVHEVPWWWCRQSLFCCEESHIQAVSDMVSWGAFRITYFYFLLVVRAAAALKKYTQLHAVCIQSGHLTSWQWALNFAARKCGAQRT